MHYNEIVKISISYEQRGLTKNTKKSFCRIAEGWRERKKKEEKNPSHIIQSHISTASCIVCCGERAHTDFARERERECRVSVSVVFTDTSKQLCRKISV